MTSRDMLGTVKSTHNYHQHNLFTFYYIRVNTETDGYRTGPDKISGNRLVIKQ